MTHADRRLATALAMAAWLLPPAARARWQEESLAILLDAPAARRRRYVVDTFAKLPVLAWQQWRGPAAGGHPTLATVAGISLLAGTAVMVGTVLFGSAIGEDAAEFLLLVATCTLAPAVALRAVTWAARAGGGVRRYAAASLLTALAGTGPVGPGLLGTAAVAVLPTGGAAVALTAAAVPGGWLLHTSLAGLRRRRGPRSLALLGAVAGAGLIGLLVGVQLFNFAVPAWLPTVLSGFGFLAFLPSYLCWSIWAGLRLLTGRSDLPVATTPVP